MDQKYFSFSYPYSFCGIKIPYKFFEILFNWIYAWDLNFLYLKAIEKKNNEEKENHRETHKEEKELMMMMEMQGR